MSLNSYVFPCLVFYCYTWLGNPSHPILVVLRLCLFLCLMHQCVHEIWLPNLETWEWVLLLIFSSTCRRKHHIPQSIRTANLISITLLIDMSYLSNDEWIFYNILCGLITLLLALDSLGVSSQEWFLFLQSKLWCLLCIQYIPVEFL